MLLDNVLKVAAIDVGSNAIRLLTVELASSGRVLASDYQRYPVRLGADVFSTGRVSEERATAMLAAFQDIRERLDARGVERYRAIGTAAMREAKNQRQLIRDIQRCTGIRLEVIDGEEEAALARQALIRAVGRAPTHAMLVDLGGGSLELQRVRGRGGGSWPLGTVRLTERYPQLQEPLTADQLRYYVCEVKRELTRYTRMNKPAPVMIGTGGNLVFLTDALPLSGAPVPAVDLSKLPELAANVASLTPGERVRAYRLRPDRAEIVAAALVVVLALVERFAVKSLLVPGTGLRESILHQLITTQQIASDVQRVAARFGGASREAERRVALVTELFRITAAWHGLWEPALVPLVAAAGLLGAGRCIDPDHPAPHTAYVLEHASGLPLDAECRRVAAATATAAVGAPLPADMRPEDMHVAHTLGALLGLAEALRRAGARRIIAADTLANPVRIGCGLRERFPRRSVEVCEQYLGVRLKLT